MNFLAFLRQAKWVDSIMGRYPRRGRMGPRFGLERLEDRIVLSAAVHSAATVPILTAPSAPQSSAPPGSYVASFDSETPVPIAIGTVKAGQVIRLGIDFTTSDPQDQFEGEPLILLGSDGYSVTIASYGMQEISFPISEDGETLSAYIQGADGDENASISVSSAVAQILINETPATSDNIALFNPASSALPYAQTIDAKISNFSGTVETYQLSVQQDGSGNVDLSESSVTLAPGTSTDITLTPTADSSAPNDVHIIASNGGVQVAEDDMTVVSAQFPKFIYNSDTPEKMVSGGFYRIPPRVATPTSILITPDLAGSGQSVTLLVANQSGDAGTVALDGAGMETLTGSAQVNLTGASQTTPGHAAQLNLLLQVDGSDTIQSDGFSVAAIPQNYTETFASAVTQADFSDGNGTVAARGLIVDDGWSSDSGVLGDLDQAQLSEVVQNTPGTGAFVSPGNNHTSDYLPAAQFTSDTHANSLSALAALIAAHGANGTQQSLQTNKFADARTGARDIPMANSGYTISRTLYAVHGVAYLTTTKVGAATTANGISSAAGAGSATVTQVVENLPPGDPLMVTTQPPSTITAGQSFGLVVTVENADGSTNTAYNGTVAVTSADGSPLAGATTVNAVKGVATFAGLTETSAGVDALDVTGGVLPQIATQSFTVQAAPATQLVFLEPPTSGIAAGAPFNIEVNVVDPFQNVDTSYNGSITLALIANPGNATLAGTLTVNAVNGHATFPGLKMTKGGNGYIVRATAGGLAAVTSSPFDVTDQLVVTMPPPGTVSVNVPFSMAVAAEDGQGNVDTSFSGTVTLLDNAGNPLGGTLSVMAINGVATFAGLTLNTAGADSLSVSAPGLPSTSTPVFTVAPAKAVKIDIEGPNGVGPGNVISSPFGLDVDAEDANGNVDPTYSGSVTLSLLNNPGNSTLGGTLTVAIINGQATFAGLTINNLGNGYTLQAVSAGLMPDISAPFDVTDQVVVTTEPPEIVAAAAPFGLVVSAEAGLGTIATAYTGNVTLALSNYGSNDATLLGTLTEPTINGVATFSGLTISQAGSYGLVVSGNGLAGSATNEFTVTSNTAMHLALTASPQAVTAGAGFALQLSAEDSSGNVDTHYTGNVTLALAGNPANGILGGIVTAPAINGVASFTNLTISNPGAGYTLQATAAGLPAVIGNSIDVTPPGVANQLVITDGAPASVTAGSSITGLTVAAEDGFGKVITSFNGNVTVALAADPGGAPLFGTLTVPAINGVATFNGLIIDQAANGFTLAASSIGLASGTTAAFNVAPAAADHLIIVGLGNVLTGGTFGAQVEAEDGFGNLDTNFAGPVTLALGNSAGETFGGTLTIAAVGGVATFSGLSLNNVAVGLFLNATGSHLATGVSPFFNVTSDQLVISAQPPASVGEMTGFSIVVRIEDAEGNLDTSANNVSVSLVNFSGNNAFLGGASVALPAVNGVVTFSGLTIDRPGNYALSLSTGITTANTASTNPFVVTAAATRLAVTTAPPPNSTAGAPFEVDIAAEDSAGNIDTGFNGSVTLSLAAGFLGGTLSVTAVNGVAAFPGLTINSPASGYIIKAVSAGLMSIATGAIDVAVPGVATQLVVTTEPPASIAAGGSFNFFVTAEDGAGTTATSFTGLVTLVLNNYSTNPNAQLAGTLTTGMVNGVARFFGLSLTAAGNFALSASSNNLPVVTSALFAVTPLAASHLVIAAPTDSVQSGAPFAVNVQAQDAYGNVDPNFNGSVTLSLAANPGNSLLTGTLTATAVNGVASFTGVAINNPDPGYTLRATANGLASGASSPFTVTNDQLVITTQPPASVRPQVGFGLVVAAEDGSGAVDTLFDGTITLSLPLGSSDTLEMASGPPFPSAPLRGPLMARAVHGIAIFSNLLLTQAGYDTLVATSSGLAQATTGLFSVTPVADRMALTEKPPAVAGAPFEVQVTGEDAFGNVDTSFTGAQLSFGENPGNGAFVGTPTVTTVNGVVTFAGLAINNPGVGYTLQLSSPTLAALTTDAINVTPAGTATHWVITTQPPAHLVAGGGFGLVVKAEDSFGAVDNTFTGGVTLSDPAATLTGTLTVNAVNGIATFGGLTLSQAGDHLLSISGSALAPATTSLITVTGAPATSLAIIGPDSNVLPGFPFGVTVLAVDSNGNIDSTFAGPVTLSLPTNPAASTLGGALTASAINGMATFTGLTVTNAAPGYALAATSNTLSAVMPFDVTADQLILTTPPPDSVPAGSAFGLVVAAVNPSGRVDTSFTGRITLSLINLGPDNGAVLNRTTVTAVRGAAFFTGLTISQMGSYSLSITSTGLGGSNTNNVEVTAPVPAPSTAVPALGRVALPATVIVGANFRARVPVVITNGGAKLSGQFTVNLYADLGTSLDGNQVLLATFHRKFTLKPGKSRPINFNLRAFPKALQKGTYHFLVQVIDPTGASNLIATPQTVQLAAATLILKVSPQHVLPSQIPVKKSASILVTLENDGNSPARGVLKLTLSPSSDGIAPLPGVTLTSLSRRVLIGARKRLTFRLHFTVTQAAATGTFFPLVTASLNGVTQTAVGKTQFTFG